MQGMSLGNKVGVNMIITEETTIADIVFSA